MKHEATFDQGRRDRILDAGEDAFAEHGFDGASLRHIVTRARVNLATVYYYFGSKQGLMEAVLKRRFGPLRQEQLDGLRRLEEQEKARPLPVEKVLAALLLPSLRMAASDPAKRKAVARLIGRIATDPNPHTQEILRRGHAEVRAAFHKTLQEHAPDMRPGDLHWRLEFVWGALAFVLCNPRQIEKETGGACNPIDTDQVAATMIEFFSPGFKSKGTGAKSPAPRAKFKKANTELQTARQS
jgi:AcrR family transcriptional regulator